MNVSRFKILLSFLTIAIVFSACKEEEETLILPPDITHYAVTFGMGSNWVDGQPIFQQDITEHFNYQIGLFGTGTLKAAGFLLEEDKGFYLQGVTTEADIDQIIADDPAMQAGIFAVDTKEPVAILAEQVLDSIAVGTRAYYLIEYTPANNWTIGKKLWELDLTDHQNYMEGKFAEGVMMRGAQFLDIDKAVYIILANDLSEVQTVIDNDPAVLSNTFQSVIKPWALNVNQL